MGLTCGPFLRACLTDLGRVLWPVASASFGARERCFFEAGDVQNRRRALGGWVWDRVQLWAVFEGPFDELGAYAVARRVGVLRGSRTVLFVGWGRAKWRARARRGRACQHQSLTSARLPDWDSFSQSGRRRGPWTCRGGAGVTSRFGIRSVTECMYWTGDPYPNQAPVTRGVTRLRG